MELNIGTTYIFKMGFNAMLIRVDTPYGTTRYTFRLINGNELVVFNPKIEIIGEKGKNEYDM